MALKNLPATDLSQETTLNTVVKRAIESVPSGSTIICFSDISCFSLLSAQVVTAGRTDVYILPVTPQINTRRYLKAQGQIQKFGYPDNPFRIADSLSWTLYQGRRVFVTELPDFYIKLLGLDGKAYRLSPWILGYEVSCLEKPVTAPDRSGFTFSQNEVDRRNTNKYLQNLVFNPKLIGDRTPETSKPWTCPTPNEHYLRAMKCRKTGNRQCAYNELYWSTLKDPLDLGLRYQLAFMYEQAQFEPLAKREYRHLLLIDPGNASAGAGLARLAAYPDL